ncbi:hypothetical protein D4764_04G0000920 [Takifugu flavidus]|uniref:Integrase catalytic domain-containing protein n=1 Tax=Takifugu flavidus TaxID=433684 RepID=A0A5C6N2S8_9TELE|nr:hypothetical protein D4764_04G0000920 [Takifugu flavidus]
MLQEEMQIPLQQSIFWTDSTTVLKYIDSETARYKTFVANRITLIREATKPSQWSRRGQISIMRSDNGTNFVGAEKELREAVKNLDQSEMEKTMQERGIKWIFNSPAASHQGGIWERQIRTVRRILGALLKEQTLTDDSLQTFFTQPNMPPGIFNKDDQYARKRWRQIHHFFNLLLSGCVVSSQFCDGTLKLCQFLLSRQRNSSWGGTFSSPPQFFSGTATKTSPTRTDRRLHTKAQSPLTPQARAVHGTAPPVVDRKHLPAWQAPMRKHHEENTMRRHHEETP